MKEIMSTDNASKFPDWNHRDTTTNGIQRLDEAAFEYENTLWEDGCKDCGYSPLEVLDAFKAGAEWMAGQMKQGQTEVDLKNYISGKLRELGADLINHKPYSFNRGLNVGNTKAYHDILDRLNARK